MCALAGYVHSSISATIKSYLKAFAAGLMRSMPWPWRPRRCASPVTSHEVARGDGTFGGHGCVDTLRWVSGLESVMTIPFQKRVANLHVMLVYYCVEALGMVSLLISLPRFHTEKNK
jgi:hypothetical protein